jgi:hypothetical protein
MEEQKKEKNLSKSDPEGAMMYIACSRCKKILDIKPGNLGSITHSLCDDCLKKTLQEIEVFKKKQKKEE